MEVDPLEKELDENPLEDENVNENNIIDTVESSHAWTAWQDQLTHDMYNEWRGTRGNEVSDHIKLTDMIWLHLLHYDV